MDNTTWLQRTVEKRITAASHALFDNICDGLEARGFDGVEEFRSHKAEIVGQFLAERSEEPSRSPGQ